MPTSLPLKFTNEFLINVHHAIEYKLVLICLVSFFTKPHHVSYLIKVRDIRSTTTLKHKQNYHSFVLCSSWSNANCLAVFKSLSHHNRKQFILELERTSHCYSSVSLFFYIVFNEFKETTGNLCLFWPNFPKMILSRC